MTISLGQGVLPALSDELTGEIIPMAHEIQPDLVQMAAARSREKLPSFLVAVWAVVMRQFIESESVCFGLHIDGPPDITQGCCQVSMSPQTTVKGLLESRPILLSEEEKPVHNTGVVVSDVAVPADPAALLNKLESEKAVSLPP